jgi:hypothetical protein
VPKYRAASKLFGCLEIDVVVDPPDGGPAAVYHPPDRNYHGLTLHFLLSNEGLPAGKLWVDVKDLSEEHWPALLELLSSHVPDDRRGDVMIETGWGDDNVSAAANAFRENGFVFSYYLPTGEAIDCGSESSISCDRFRTQVKWITSLGFSHLSFDARAMDFVRTIKADLPNDMRLLTWSLGRSWPSLDLLRQVDVCLVRFPSPYST